VGIYCRVSSSGQEDNYSLETQETSCREFARDHGWSVTRVYREVHSGAELFERPQLGQLREEMRAGSFDVLLVHALDRLSRKQTHLGLILSEAEHAGVVWESATEEIDDSPQGQILREVISGMAEMERLKIAERTQRGKRARVESGKYNVGSHAPFGYQWADPATKERLVENPVTSPIVRRIFRTIANGGSARQMALALTAEGVPTPKGIGDTWYWSTIRTIVRNPLYWGEARAYRTQRSRVKGRGRVTRPRPEHEQVILGGVAPALVTPEVAHAVLNALSRNRLEATRNNKSPRSSLLRAGFARCGYCGNYLESQHAHGGWAYRCGTSNRDKYGCPSFSIMAPIIDQIAWSKVEEIIRQPEIIAREVERLKTTDPVEKDLASIERRLAEIGRLRGNLARRLAQFDDDEAARPIIAEMEALSRQERQLQSERDELVAQRASWELAQHRLQDLEYWCSVQARNLEELTYEQKRLALHAMNLTVKVWATSHSPRYEIQVELPVLGETRNINDPHSGCDGGHGEGHVDDCTRRGYATKGGCRADLL
jgi:site-specific DNA recombinase